MASQRYAGFWIRGTANLLDSLLLTLVSWVLEMGLLGLLWLVLRTGDSMWDVMSPLAIQGLNIFLYMALAVPYYSICHLRWGATPPKRWLKIRVVSEDGARQLTPKQAWGRTFAYLASYLPLGLGFVWAAFNPKKKAFHDILAETVSIRTK